MNFRQAVPEDLDDIHHIENTCFKKPWSYESLRSDLCGNEIARYFVAQTQDGQIVGYCGVHIIYDAGHIMNVAVLPEYRNRGVGRGLLQTLFGQTDLPYYTLEVRESNHVAIRLYEKLGFAAVGTRPAYYGDEDALIMWRGEIPSC